MGKKRKGNRPPSKRRHDESATNRYRQVTSLIPVNRDNEPIPVPRKELAKAMLEVTGQKTTHAEQSYQPEPQQPDNVVSLCDRRKAANVESFDNKQEAQANINYDRLLFHEWSQSKGKRYVSKREAEAWEFRRLLEYSASHPKGRNYPDDADLNKPKAKKQKPISTVHNPGISSERIEYGGYSPSSKYRARPIVVHNRMNREGQVTLYDPRIHAPSGLPIKEFTEGKYAPPKTQQSTEVHRSVVSKPKSSANSTWTTEEQLYLMLDMVPEEHWPMAQLRDYLFQDDNGKWRVHTGKVRKAVSNSEDRGIHRAVTLAFIRKTEDQEDYITALEADQQGLLAQQRILEFQYSRLIGEPVDNGVLGTAQYIRHKSATTNAKSPTKHELVAEQQRIQQQLDQIEAEETLAAQKKMQMLRLRILFKQVPVLIAKTNDHWRSAKPRPLFNVVKERKAHRRMVASAKRAEYQQRVNLSGLVIYLSNKHWQKMKITTEGKQFVLPTEHYVEVRAIDVPRLLPRSEVNYLRVINKAVGAMNLPVRYQPIEPTYLLFNDQVEYSECDNTTARMRRWAKWLPVCEERDTDRQQQEQEQAALDARQECVERNREVMSKPINRLINKVSLVLEKAWQFGQRDVYVTPTERAKREENERILRERTRNEIEAQQKQDEQDRREEAEREARRAARREERRRKKDQKRAAKAKAEEQAAAKAAARKAFRNAH